MTGIQALGEIRTMLAAEVMRLAAYNAVYNAIQSGQCNNMQCTMQYNQNKVIICMARPGLPILRTAGNN